MRKNISVTNQIVIDALTNADNASKLIEIAILFYLDAEEKGYVTKDEVEEIVEQKLIRILNPNYNAAELEAFLNRGNENV